MGGGGGGSKKGGGGGGGSTANIQGLESALGQQGQMFGGLGGWETQFLSNPYNIGNYAMDLATGGGGPQAVSYGNFGYGTEGVTPYGGGGGGGGAGGNPWVSAFQNTLSQENQAAGYSQQQAYNAQTYANDLYALGSQEAYGVAGTEFNRAQQLQRQLNRGGGLLPDQQALIQAQVAAGKGQLNQTLASQGLGNSSMGATLGAEIGLQGAATGGQLIQGNEQLLNQAYGTANQAYGVANQANSIANMAQGTAFQGQGQFFNQLASIGQQNLGAQSQFFNQAMQGYGLEGQALQNVLAPYGYQLNDYQTMGNLSIQNAQIQEEYFAAQQQAQSAGMSGLFSGLGSLLGGGGGGSGGGLLGGIGGALGGLFGGGSAAIGGSAAAGTVADLAPLVAGLAW